MGVFELGSVVRRTEPHVRYPLLDSVRGSCLSLFSCVTFDFSMWVFCESHQGKKARPSGPPGGASLLVNRNDVRPRYAGPKDEDVPFFAISQQPLPSIEFFFLSH